MRHRELSEPTTGEKPAAITREECDVIGDCDECGRESGDDYRMHVPAGQWQSGLSDIGWHVVDGRLICFDCYSGESA